MNCYLKNLNKIEFVVTYACTGRCKHCSEGAHALCGEHILPETAAEAVRRVANAYGVKTVMAFGGEPLLFPEAVYAIMGAAKEMGVPKRQVITNGFFSRENDKISEVAKRLSECGVNDLLVSVDAFHQESIPIEIVRFFLAEAKKGGIPIRLQPAWLVSPLDGNIYNEKTREILDSLSDLSIPVSEGNTVFPEGNALKYLAEYFADYAPENPYIEDPCDVKCLSFSPNGDILGGNIYKNDIIDIIKGYTPNGAAL